MNTINQMKQSAETDAPLLLFRCVLSSGTVCTWSTQAFLFFCVFFLVCVLCQNLFDL